MGVSRSGFYKWKNRDTSDHRVHRDSIIAAVEQLYFYANSSRDDAVSRMEIDFLIAKSKISNRHNISPIEVKSGKHYTLSSLKKFRTKYAQQLHTPYVLHTSDVKEEEGITYLPLYMAPLL